MATVSKAKAKKDGTYVHVPSKTTKLTHFTKIDSGWYRGK
jgi:hypothetical protein